MSYYILPKNINNINVNPTYSNDKCCPYVSYSLLNYYNEIKQQIIDMFTYEYDLSDNCIEEAIKIINPYEFIFSKVPGSKFSVSKLKPKNNIFYDLLEIYTNLNIFESFKSFISMNILHVSPNHDDAIECFEIFREGLSNKHIFNDTINLNTDIQSFENNFDFIFYEVDFSNYFESFIKAIIIIFSSQNSNGVSIIKIGDIFYKPVVDILYILSSLYDKVYICKPSTNNITSYERYIVCKNYALRNFFNYFFKIFIGGDKMGLNYINFKRHFYLRNCI